MIYKYTVTVKSPDDIIDVFRTVNLTSHDGNIKIDGDKIVFESDQKFDFGDLKVNKVTVGA